MSQRELKGLRKFMKPKRSFTMKVQKVIDRNLEKKFVSQQQATISVGDGTTIAGSGINLSDVVVGNDQFQRTGNEVRLTGMFYTLHMAPSPSTILANYYSKIRVIVYIPKEATYVIPTTHPYDALIDLDRITVLHDKTYTVGYNSQLNLSPIFKKSFLRKGASAGLQQRYADGTATSQTKNRIKLYVVSDQSLASELPIYTMVGRTYFTDA